MPAEQEEKTNAGSTTDLHSADAVHWDFGDIRQLLLRDKYMIAGGVNRINCCKVTRQALSKRATTV